uniref:DUF6522 family protein n=1 Tax=Pararhizobium sp. IMCC3301 TaxID=3067904 RepID=UPI002741F30B|nr:DUF6522 family protein [Pararhizobium sp. IMCC3301]
MSAISISGAEITVDAVLVAEGFDMSEEKLRTLMRAGTITSRCETGEGEDAGRTRLNFLYGNRVLRLTVDAEGNLIEPAQIHYAGSALLDARRSNRGGE